MTARGIAAISRILGNQKLVLRRYSSISVPNKTQFSRRKMKIGGKTTKESERLHKGKRFQDVVGCSAEFSSMKKESIFLNHMFQVCIKPRNLV